ncbi:hypothetical protein [Kingella negevensis]|uniref:hypothetical protein n=1 Tax=Kingella negevensis TaxID=1522312 RepID=UPI00050A2FA3|nr:hypothetical protein [Kingella negevensis]MDK4687831.1 hypothetical protein [Kingella negevensis]WII91174.1 hypothetical protein QEO93_00840 [Kingella negevensis]
MRKPHILLGMPNHNKIYEILLENLLLQQFEVTLILSNTIQFHYPNKWEHIKTKFRQVILCDKFAKDKLLTKINRNHCLSAFEHNITFDYALFIRGDLFHNDVLKKAQENSLYGVYNYQWDGMNRYPNIWDKLGFINKIYAFDPTDIINHPTQLLPATNFYFDHPFPLHNKIEYDFYFLGSHITERTPAIISFIDYIRDKSLTYHFTLVCANSTQFKKIQTLCQNQNINLEKESSTFSENLELVKKAKILLDFKNDIHNGLSFRPFEALGYRKKLITTHADIVKYDFYHPNNIFVWDGKTFDGIDEFLAAPYHELAPEIYEKYSFGNWIRYILNIEPHHKIELPR